MYYFKFYGDLAFHVTMLLCVGLVLLAFIIHYSVRAYKKPVGEDGVIDEHADPGIPLVLKGLYIGMAIYILVATIWVAVAGIAI